MTLSNDLISQFVKITNDSQKKSNETTLYGTIDSTGTQVKLDGSPDNVLTPISSTTNIKPGDRVTVMIKNHTAVVTGNLTSPAPRSDDVADATAVATKITELEILVADTVHTDEFTAEMARIDSLEAANVTITNNISVNTADIQSLESENVNVKKQLTANSADIDTLKTSKLDVTVATATYATIEELKATNADIYNLEATHANFVEVTGQNFSAVNADITALEANKLSAESASLTFANIDFSNIGNAAMEYLYSVSGLIENVVIGDGTITGYLAGVTIRGDLIEANTLIADKLVILGEDGLYYKLNTNGMTVGAEQTEYNSLNGNIILAKSVTAEKVNVSDLVAFDATIGGFNITEDAIFSEVKDSEGNTTRGTYMDKNGQVNFGDESKFIKYYQDDDGTWKLAISADSILYTLDGKQLSVSDLGIIGEYVHISTYEGEPCIELGEGDSEFKLRITNTRMIFTEGTVMLAYFNNQSLYINKAVIEEELQQGEFVWKARSNGNLGLMWIGGDA